MVRGPISLVIVSVVTLAILALVVGGPKVFDGILPPRVVEMLATVMEPGQMNDGPVKGDGKSPDDYLDNNSDGLVARGPIAARFDNEPVFIADVISGYTTRVESDLPAEIMTVRPILGCRLTPPLQGTAVGHVVAGTSGVRTALSTYNDTMLAAAVQGFVNVYRESGVVDPFLTAPDPYQAYDVAVTETRAPVYLVLENRWTTPRLWNIHLAEGARIERVILLGGGQAGVANLDPVVPVEVILHDGLEACGIAPAYPLNEEHLFFQSMESGAISSAEAEEKLALIKAGVAAYDTWFRDSFGIAASESRIGFDKGTISVVGPVPGAADPKAVFAPIKGAKIRTTQDQFFEIQGQVAKGEGFGDRVRAIATNFAFGNLDYLRQGVRF